MRNNYTHRHRQLPKALNLIENPSDSSLQITPVLGTKHYLCSAYIIKWLFYNSIFLSLSRLQFRNPR